MYATHLFTFQGVTGYYFAGGMIRWNNWTCHIEDAPLALQARARLCRKPVIAPAIRALSLDEAQARNPGKA